MIKMVSVGGSGGERRGKEGKEAGLKFSKIFKVGQRTKTHAQQTTGDEQKKE